MFLLDSLMISGIRWTLETVLSAADAELNDEAPLREQMLDALQRRELGEISEARYRAIETDLLTRIREIKTRRDGAQGPLAFGRQDPADASGDARIQVEASVVGEFHNQLPAGAPTSIAPASATNPVPVAPARPRRPTARSRRRAAAAGTRSTARKRS